MNGGRGRSSSPSRGVARSRSGELAGMQRRPPPRGRSGSPSRYVPQISRDVDSKDKHMKTNRSCLSSTEVLEDRVLVNSRLCSVQLHEAAVLLGKVIPFSSEE